MINPHLKAFYDRLERKYSVDAANMGVSEWLEKNTRLRGKPFSFARYEFQRAIADDMHPNMSVKKCSQVGLTEVQIRKILSFLRRHNGTKGIFTLPNEKMFKRVSNARIKPLFNENPTFSAIEDTTKATNSMGLMQIDQSFLFVTGATEGDATSIDADIVFNDEVDLTEQSMLALFNSRMQNSTWKISQGFSTPSFVGFGIDLGFQSSDQREYMCKCAACGHHNIPDFDFPFVHIPGLEEFRDNMRDLSELELKMVDRLDLDNAYVVCEKCHAPLDLDDTSAREWVAKMPNRTHARGYNVLPFVTSRLDIKYIVAQLLKYKERNYVRGWHNTVVGRAFTDSNAQLSEADIRANLQGEAPLKLDADDPCWMGIDVGQICHVTIGKGGHSTTPVTNFLVMPVKELVPFVRNFCEHNNLIAGAVDRHPYTPTAEALFQVSDGRIFPVEYRGQREINAVKDPEDNITHFQANRTQMIDEVAKRVRLHELPMHGYGNDAHTLIAHLRDMVRDEVPEEPAVWRKLTGVDHWFHSLAFLCFAQKIKHFIDVTSEAESRVMLGVVGVDVRGPTDSLVGSSRISFESLNALPTRRNRLLGRMSHG